jgi:glucose/arabinose dehydrogenase
VASLAVAAVFFSSAGQPAYSETPSAHVGSLAVTEPPLHAVAPPVIVATGIPFPAYFAFDPRGGLWVASATIGETPSEGVWYVPSAGHPAQKVQGLAGTSSLVWSGNRLFAAVVTRPGEAQVRVLQGFTGDRFAQSHVLVNGLSSGSHGVGIVQGPNGRLFVGLGALEDSSGPPGRIISVSPSGGAPVLAATGLRTAFGLAFWGSRLLFTDNGPDNPGDSPDLLQMFNPAGRVVDFGFPKCYGQGGTACVGYPKPLVAFPSHSTPEGLVVKGDVAYVAFFGGPTVPGHPAPRSGIDSIDLRTGQVGTFWRSTLPEDLVGLALGPDGDLYASGVVSGKVLKFDLH